jgi:hypothetical protein
MNGIVPGRERCVPKMNGNAVQGEWCCGTAAKASRVHHVVKRLTAYPTRGAGTPALR